MFNVRKLALGGVTGLCTLAGYNVFLSSRKSLIIYIYIYAEFLMIGPCRAKLVVSEASLKQLGVSY